jgi:hypothetical protein
MNGIIRKIVYAVIFAAALVGAKYGYDQYVERKAVAKAEKVLKQTRKDGIEKNPGVPQSEALRRQAVEVSAARIEGQTNDKKRFLTAASTFMGFYLVNTRERHAYCRERGVDTTPFVAAFDNVHRSELAAARAGLAKTAIKEDELYEMLQAQFRKTIADDMNDIASSQKLSVKQACELIADNGKEFAVEMHISKFQPVVYQVLTTGQ